MSKYIKQYSSEHSLFGLTFQTTTSKDSLNVGVSSMNISTNNKIEIINFNTTIPEEEIIEPTPNPLHKGVLKSSIDCEFPNTKIMFSPFEQSNSVMASTAENWSLYKYAEDKLSLTATLTKNNQMYCGPWTSMDWSKTNPAIIGVASIDTTCTIWDIVKMEVKTIFIAHDKEVYDISLGPDEFTFMTTGADGSIRSFDTRTPDSCSIIIETPEWRPMTILNWNLLNVNLIIAVWWDRNEIYIIDQRNTNTPYAIWKDHTNVVNNAIWAPGSSTNWISVSDDKTALIWDWYSETDKPEEAIMEYNAGKEIENVAWSDSSSEWIGITCGNDLEIWKIK